MQNSKIAQLTEKQNDLNKANTLKQKTEQTLREEIASLNRKLKDKNPSSRLATNLINNPTELARNDSKKSFTNGILSSLERRSNRSNSLKFKSKVSQNEDLRDYDLVDLDQDEQ